MRPFYHFSLAVFTLFLLSGCSRTPDAGVAQQALEAELARANLQGLFSVEDVTKVNGFPGDDDRYTLQVSYQLHAQQSLSEFSEQVKGDDDLPAMERFATIMALAALRLEYGNFKKGSSFTEERQLQFRKGDEGWQLIQE